MMMSNVRNKKSFGGRGNYIGRPGIFGNPFSHKGTTLAEIQVETRHDAVMRFARWLILGTDAALKRTPDIIRKAILAGQLNNTLPLICWCCPEACHGHVLEEVRTPELLRAALANPDEFLARIETKIRNLEPQRRLF